MGCPALRGLVYAGIATFAIILTFAALGTTIGEAKQNGVQNFYTKRDVSLWRLCTKQRDQSGTSPKSCISTTDEELDCAKSKDYFRAAQAFYIMTTLMLAAAIALGLFDHFQPATLDRCPVLPKLIFFIFVLVLFVLSLIAWAIAVAIPHTDFCGSGNFVDAPGFKYGASPFLMLVVWLLTIPMAIVCIFMPPRHSGESLREAAKANHRSNIDNNAPV
jgi:uncharacterized membrane protein